MTAMRVLLVGDDPYQRSIGPADFHEMIPGLAQGPAN